jgi:hypothetical protein
VPITAVPHCLFLDTEVGWQSWGARVCGLTITGLASTVVECPGRTGAPLVYVIPTPTTGSDADLDIALDDAAAAAAAEDDAANLFKETVGYSVIESYVDGVNGDGALEGLAAAAEKPARVLPGEGARGSRLGRSRRPGPRVLGLPSPEAELWPWQHFFLSYN